VHLAAVPALAQLHILKHRRQELSAARVAVLRPVVASAAAAVVPVAAVAAVPAARRVVDFPTPAATLIAGPSVSDLEWFLEQADVLADTRVVCRQ
jgi:hypothetical protein